MSFAMLMELTPICKWDNASMSVKCVEQKYPVVSKDGCHYDLAAEKLVCKEPAPKEDCHWDNAAGKVKCVVVGKPDPVVIKKPDPILVPKENCQFDFTKMDVVCTESLDDTP